MSQVATSAPEVVRFSVFELDRRTGELRKQGRKLKIEGQPLLLLDLLLRHPDELVTREEVRRTLWPDDTFVDYEHSINAAVKRLRQALDDSAETPRFVETVPRRGYRFIYPLNHNGRPHREEAKMARKMGIAAAAIVAVTCVVAGLATVALLRYRQSITPPQIASIAVLPFENLSGDPAQDYLADGLTEDLIADLSHIRAFSRVTSRTSAMSYKGFRKPLREIRQELGVDAVVEGSFTREGERVRVVVQVIETATDRHIWSESFESDVHSILDLRGNIARRVAHEIRIKLTEQERDRLAQRSTANPLAYDAYLKARYLQSKWDNTANLPKAIALYDQAIREQPDLAPAHAGRSMAQIYLAAALMEVVPPVEVISQAKAEALKALELDPRSAEAYEALGWVQHNHEWNWAAAEESYRKAIELNPNYAPPYMWLGHLMQTTGRRSEAPALMERAHELDPLSPHVHWSVAEAYMLAGEMQKAEEECRETITLHADFWPAHALLGNILLWQKRYAESIASMKKAVDLSNRHPYALGMLASAYALAGERREALRIVDELNQVARTKYVAPPVMVRAYASLGLRREAVDWLRKAQQNRCSETPRVPLWGPVVASFRGYSPYEDLLTQVGVKTAW